MVVGEAKLFGRRDSELYKEPLIRERLNEILAKAVEAYNEDEYENFFNTISEVYNEETGAALIKLEDVSDVVDCKVLINTLLQHGFRPDGIAYLLTILGEVLCSGKLKIANFTRSDLNMRGEVILNGVLDERLVEEANILDDRISKLRENGLSDWTGRRSLVLNALRDVLDAVLLKDHAYLARELINDAQQMPFEARLNEMRHVAKINIALYRILKGDDDELKRAQELLESVRTSIETNFQYVTVSHFRLEILEDFLWVMSGIDHQYPEDPKLLITVTPAEPDIIQDTYLKGWSDRLLEANTVRDKIDIIYKKAAHYEKLAQEKEKDHQLTSLRMWKDAKDQYREALKLSNRFNVVAEIGLARCLLKLGKYKESLDFLAQRVHLSIFCEFWITCSIAYRKRLFLNRANGCIQEALKIDPKNKIATREFAIIKTLISKKEAAEGSSTQSEIEKVVKECDEAYYQTRIKECDEAYFTTKKKETTPFYKILSIDGGGLRGIIPAVWLAEIEKRSHRPVSHLFNLLSGTSTGGIISLGLSVPKFEMMDEVYIYSNYAPAFTAHDILNLYLTKSSKIFKRPGLFSRTLGFKNTLRAPKYVDSRLDVFKDKFGFETNLGHLLNDVVIPATYENSLIRTHLFNRFDARKDPDKNYRIYDVAMATSAAPTFFAPYRIKEDSYLDGGVQTNNPSLVAHAEALRYGIPASKIFTLSLGTGSHIPDPANPNASRGLLFWAMNIIEPALHANEGNTDYIMHQSLGDRYQRWQVWLEEAIALDQNDPFTIDALQQIAVQHIEELDASENNSFNKLVETLLSDVEYSYKKPGVQTPTTARSGGAEPTVFSQGASALSGGISPASIASDKTLDGDVTKQKRFY